MTINTIVSQLKYGELRSIAIASDNFAIVSYINLALIELYSRFQLKISEHIIDSSDNIAIYTLPTDCMTILSIYDENGNELVIDDPTNQYSASLVGYNSIQLANPATGTSFSVIYIASPTELVYVDEGNLTDTVPIPPQLLEPLLHYVGYRAHGSMDGNIKAENNTHYMRYEASCKQIEERGSIRHDVVPANVSRQEFIDSDITDIIPKYSGEL